MIDWSDYARVYDLMCRSNPAYQAMLTDTLTQLDSCGVPADATLLDLGAGTGNFSLALAERFPNATVLHVDADPAMLAHAQAKASARSLANVRFVRADLCAPGPVAWAQVEADLVLSVHALYACPDPPMVLRRAYAALRPGGRACFINLGRTLDVGGWSRYLFSTLVRQQGFAAAIRTFIEGVPVARANRQIARLQRDGTYWTHSTSEFVKAIRAAGFAVDGAALCYRGCSDRVLCRRPVGVEVPVEARRLTVVR